MPENPVMVQTALMPLYYKDFHCLAGACRDSCCAGWKIEFNKKDYLAIKRAVDASKDEGLKELCGKSMARLREREHDKMYAEFPMNEEDRCGFLRKDGLCALQLGCGEGALPNVCKTFPRLERYTLAAREFSLSPACEGVLTLLWDLPDGIDFWEEPLEKKDQKIFTPVSETAARFADIRSLCVDIIQERSLGLSKRLLLLGFLLQQLRDLDWGNGEAVDAWLVKAEKLLHDPVMAKELDELQGSRKLFMSSNLRVALSIHDGSSSELARELINVVSADGGTREFDTTESDESLYRKLERKLEELLGHSEYFFENLIVATMLDLDFPNLADPEDMWKGYVNLCNLYSFFRFAAVCGCDKEVSKERLFHVLVGVSRALLHNNIRRNQLQDEFFQNDSATLAHMAILVSG